jgi:hypothetical protein
LAHKQVAIRIIEPLPRTISGQGFGRVSVLPTTTAVKMKLMVLAKTIVGKMKRWVASIAYP